MKIRDFFFKSAKNFGPIGLAVLTFIGYKQTNKQTDKPNLYIDGTEDMISIDVPNSQRYLIKRMNGQG